MMYFDINQHEEIQAGQGDPASAPRIWWPTEATANEVAMIRAIGST
jgi:hypothetical protein